MKLADLRSKTDAALKASHIKPNPARRSGMAMTLLRQEKRK